jgi:hypothetical protein
MDLNVVEKDGKAFIEFMAQDPTLSEEKRKIVENYNKIANEFSKMPDAWRNERSAKSTDNEAFAEKHHKEYTSLKSQYEQARKMALDLKAEQLQSTEKNGAEAIKKAMSEIKESDFNIAILQFANTSPNAEAELNRIANEASVKRLLNNENLMRSLYMSTGFVARSITKATIGLAAAPIVSGVMGGIRARARAEKKVNEAFREGRQEETFMQRKEAGKSGTYEDKNANAKGLMTNIMPGRTAVNAKEVGGFVDADSQIQRLTNLMDKLNNTDEDSNPKEYQLLLSQLNARIEYAESKYNQGLINYGSKEGEKGSVGLNYEFFKVLSEAQVKASPYSKFPIDLSKTTDPRIIDNLDTAFLDSVKETDNIDWRRNQMLNALVEKNTKDQKFEIAYFKNTEMVRGAVTGAAFSLLGMKIREWTGDIHHYFSAGHIKEAATAGVLIDHTQKPDIIEAPKQPEPVVEHNVSHINHENHTVPQEQAKEPTIEESKTEEVKVDEEIKEIKPTERIYNTGDVKDISPTHRVYNTGEQYNQTTNPKIEDVRSKIVVDGENNKIPNEPSSEPKIIDGSKTNVDEVKLSKTAELDQNNNVTPGIKTQEDVLNNTKEPTMESGAPSGKQVLEASDQPTGELKVSNEIKDQVIAPKTPETNDFIEPKANIETPNTDHIESIKEINQDNLKEVTEGSTKLGLDASKVKEVNIDKDPWKIEKTSDVKAIFGKRNLILETPSENNIDDIKHEDFNHATDEMFKQRGVKFYTHSQYEKEKELQSLFGHVKKQVEYVPALDKNAEVTSVDYFRQEPIWSDVSKVPAKYFINFNEEMLKNPGKLSPELVNKLLKAGVLKEEITTDEDGVVSSKFIFSRQSELMKIIKAYHKIDPLNEKPIGDENIDRYIGRVTRNLHKTNDGTFYALKKNVTLQGAQNQNVVNTVRGVSPQEPGDYMFRKSPMTNFGDSRYNGVSPANIAPRSGFYNVGNNNYSSSIDYTANRAVNSILGRILNIFRGR